MIKMVVFFSVAGTTTIPKTRLLQQHGPAVSPFWKNFGRRRLLSSLLSAGSFQGSLQHVRALFHITGSYLIISPCSSYRVGKTYVLPMLYVFKAPTLPALSACGRIPKLSCIFFINDSKTAFSQLWMMLYHHKETRFN